MNNNKVMAPDEVIMNKILVIRGKKVMIDMDLAELYGVETKRLNEQVKRNLKRFPEDFMFQVNQEEKEQLIIGFPHLRNLKFSSKLPHVFTEYGAVMMASVLNSDRAIEVNIQIVRIFTRLREMVLTNKEVLHKLEELERRVEGQDEKIITVFSYLTQYIAEQETPRTPIGFRIGEK